MTTFRFVEPPPPRQRGPKPNPLLVEFASALQQRSGEWAVWPRPTSSAAVASAIASRITHQHKSAPPPFRSGYEARSVDGVLYVRHVGEGES